MAKRYFFYNFSVLTDFKIPAPITDINNDVHVSHLDSFSTPAEANREKLFYQVSRQKSLFHCRDVASYIIKNGDEILVSPVEGSDPSLVIYSLINVPFGILLLQRGFFVLHGSAVNCLGKSIGFIGSSLAGKSSAALSMLAAGHKLISDDVLAVDHINSQVCLIPAYPWMKISKEMAEQAGISFDSMSILYPSAQKRRYDLEASRFDYNPPPLSCLYLLEWGEEFAIERISRSQAMIQLVAHSYGFRPRTAYPKEEGERFLQAIEFVKSVPIFRLTRPRDINQVMKLPSLIEKHLQTIN